MFHFLGATICRTWPVWIIGGLALYASLALTAPPWEQVAQDREYGFLPADAPTREGRALLRRAFPNDKQVSNAAIVVSRPHEELNDEDRAFIKNVVTPALLKLAQKEGGLADAGAANPASAGASRPIAAIRTPDDRGSGNLLISADKRAALVVIELTGDLLEYRNWPILDQVEALMAGWRAEGRIPAGLQLALAGSAAVGRDITRGQADSSHSIKLWTIAIVVFVLLLIYRAPFLAMIPLISVFMATEISLNLLSHLAQRGYVVLFEGVEVYVTIILYGTGVDYCLFLIARYREEREKGADWREALTEAIAHVGPALTASAITVMLGIGMMVFARFGKFHFAGIAVALSLAVGLCVVLTFTTSLLRLAGRWAFWPKKLAASAGAHRLSNGDWLWNSVARALLARPSVIWLATVLVMAPLAVSGILYGDDLDYNFVRRLPHTAPSLTGIKALEEHFPAGAAGPITVLIYSPDLDFLTPDSKGQIEISVLSDRLRREHAQLQLADVRSWALPLGIGWPAQEAPGEPLSEIERGLNQALKYYISSAGDLKGHVTRLDITLLQDPMSREGFAALDHLEETIRTELTGELRNAKLYFLGVTADLRDMKQVTSGDQLRIQLLVVVSVFATLVILLRRPAVALYLIASVLFSFFATLGATVLFFWWLNPADFVGLDWKVPIFLFTILVAIGEDYNIFLMTRVAEEQARHGLVDGIRVALVNTGRIITSCGLIMAGTFASLLSSSMEDLRQLGFALAFGVLLDTFVVRPILVPTFLIVLERGTVAWQKLSGVVEAAPDPTGSSTDFTDSIDLDESRIHRR